VTQAAVIQPDPILVQFQFQESASATIRIVSLEWDEAKRKSNLQRHGLDFVDAWETFLAPMLTAPDTREDYGEDRTVGIGFLRDLVVVIVFTEHDPDVTRVISLRKATSYERQLFDTYLQNRLD
jgi:hypothetical protein